MLQQRRPRQYYALLQQLFLILFFQQLFCNNSSKNHYNNNVVVNALLPCTEDSFCELMVRPGSYCIIEPSPSTNWVRTQEQDDDNNNNNNNNNNNDHYNGTRITSSTPPPTTTSHSRPPPPHIIKKGICSNPFVQGCLKTLLPEKLINNDNLKKKIQIFHTILEGRICNIDDTNNNVVRSYKNNNANNTRSIDSICKKPLIKYPEIRIHNGDWESGMFLSWIYQIILMEILEVPMSIGIGLSGVGPMSNIQDNTYDASFYNPYNLISYSTKTYSWEALQNANTILDCNILSQEYRNNNNNNRENNNNNDIFTSKTTTTTTSTKNTTTTTTTTNNNNNNENSIVKPCAHIMPEVWHGQAKEWNEALRNGYIDPIKENGQVASPGWYVPRYTISNYDGTLISYHGYEGEGNRIKLANTFKRPLLWKEYCNLISITNCTIPNNISKYYPTSIEEQNSYYVTNYYTGYFHLSIKNNCIINPKTCTGSIIGPTCTWSSYIESQLYWNNIVGLQRDGPILPNGGYTYEHQKQIWRAANATKSNVIMWWFKPDILVEEFFNTTYEFKRVVLPQPSLECSKSRTTTKERCSNDITIRRGNFKSGCDQELVSEKNVFSTSLRNELTLHITNLAYRSPAYKYISNLKLSDLQMASIFRRYNDGIVDHNTSNGGYDGGYDARYAVCTWIIDNIEHILDAIPDGYPRKLDIEQTQYKYYDGYKITAIVVACITNIIVWMTLYATYYYRNKRVMIFAQVSFLNIILIGYGFISIAAILINIQSTTTKTDNSLCTIIIWLIALGYTFELAPLLVKIATINTIMYFKNLDKKRRNSSSPTATTTKTTTTTTTSNTTTTTTNRRPSTIRKLVNKKTMTHVVLGCTLCMILYLIIWTVIIDPLSSIEEYTLGKATKTTTTTINDDSDNEGFLNDDDNNNMNMNNSHKTYYVISNIKCYCTYYKMWVYILLGSQGILLIMASILGYQSRTVRQEFNESQSLGVLIYSHFFFLLLRITVTIIDLGTVKNDINNINTNNNDIDMNNNNNNNTNNNKIILSSTIITTLYSLLYSFDTLAAVCIYIVPKVKKAAVTPDLTQQRMYRNSVYKSFFHMSIKNKKK